MDLNELRKKEPELTLQSLALLSSAHPNDTAIINQGRHITYKAFYEAADSIARRLWAKGIKPGDVVSLCMYRTDRMVLALHGILRAGAAYLPVDIQWPWARRAYVWKDSGARLVITDLTEPCPQEAETLFLSYEDLLEEPEPYSGKELLAKPQDCCLILYTSGSTGVPKGAVHTHQDFLTGLLPFPENTVAHEMWRHCQRFLGMTNTVFVLAAFETIFPLLFGRTLVLLDDEEIKDLTRMAQVMERERSDLLFATPSAMTAYLEDEHFRRALRHLRVIRMAGEVIPLPLVERLRTLTGPQTAIFSEYGMTETGMTIVGADLRVGKIRLGIPQYKAGLLLVDEENRPVKEGEKGLICFQAGHACREYLHDEARNQRTYFTMPDGGRFFKTGDLGWINEEGELEYAGRIDRIIKRNGMRVDLAEIEGCMRSLFGVRHAAVVAVENEIHVKRIYAYFDGEESVTEEDMWEHLSLHLPESMLPSGLQRMERIPLTERGKINYEGLKKLSQEREPSKQPENDRERLVCLLFSQILSVEEPGTNESFFALGGDSLRAMLLSSRLREKGYQIAYREVFAHPTAGELARLMQPVGEGRLEAPKDQPLKEAPAQGGEGSFYLGREVEAEFSLSPNQRNYLARDPKARVEDGFWICRYAILQGQRSREECQQRLCAMALRHPQLRSGFVRRGEEERQLIYRQTQLPLFWQDLRPLAEEGAKGLSPAQENVIRSFANARVRQNEIEKDIFQLGCFLLTDTTYCLVVWISHLVCDGYSIEALMDELAQESIRKEEDGFYASKRLNEETRRRNLENSSFWKEYLSNLKLSLPGGLLGGGGSGRCLCGFTLSPEETAHVRRMAGEEGVTLPARMYHRYAKALMQLGGDEQLTMICPFNIRYGEAGGCEEVIGDFVTAIPLRVFKNESALDVQRRMISVQEQGAGLSLLEIFQLGGYKRVLPFSAAPVSQIYPRKRNGRILQVNDLLENYYLRFGLRGEQLYAETAFDSRIYAPERMNQVFERWRELILL